VNRPLALLRHLLRLAHEEWEVLETVPKVRLEREPEGRLRYLEADEEARLMAACRASKNPHLTGIVTMAHETGMREGEIKSLEWPRVDLSRGVIKLEVTKSGRRREVPMRQAVYDLLAAVPEAKRHGRVFPESDFRKAWHNALQAAQIEDFRFHDLRHSFASWFVMRGGRLEALKAILGHASLKMTLRYAHLAPDYVRGEMEKTARSTARPGTLVQLPGKNAGSPNKCSTQAVV